MPYQVLLFLLDRKKYCIVYDTWAESKGLLPAAFLCITEKFKTTDFNQHYFL